MCPLLPQLSLLARQSGCVERVMEHMLGRAGLAWRISGIGMLAVVSAAHFVESCMGFSVEGRVEKNLRCDSVLWPSLSGSFVAT